MFREVRLRIRYFWHFSVRANNVSAPSRRLESVVDNIDVFGFAMADAMSNEIITEQKGVFRTNCLDWYDSSIYSWANFTLLMSHDTASIGQTSYRISCHAQPSNSISCTSDANGSKLARSGRITENSGQKTATHSLAYMQVPGRSTLVSPGVESARLGVCCRTPLRVFHEHTSTTSRTRGSRSPSICLWYVQYRHKCRSFSVDSNGSSAGELELAASRHNIRPYPRFCASSTRE